MRILTTLSSKILWGEKTCMFISNYGHRNHHYTKLKYSTPCSVQSLLSTSEQPGCFLLKIYLLSQGSCKETTHITEPEMAWERTLTAKPYDLRYQMCDNSCVLLRVSSCHTDDASCNLNIVVDKWLHSSPLLWEGQVVLWEEGSWSGNLTQILHLPKNRNSPKRL